MKDETFEKARKYRDEIKIIDTVLGIKENQSGFIFTCLNHNLVEPSILENMANQIALTLVSRREKCKEQYDNL